MNKKAPIIDVIRHNTLEYVFECLSYFNMGQEEVILRSYGGNLARGVEVARILEQKAGIHIGESKLESMQIEETGIPYMEIPLTITTSPLDKINRQDKGTIRKDFGNNDFVNYSTYHLLLDSYLKKKSLKIWARIHGKKAIPLISIEDKQGTKIFDYFEDKDSSQQIERINTDEIKNALSRSGLFLPAKWNEIGNRLSQYDDVILGLDTNILYNCTISRHLLPIVSLVEPKEFVHTPNWLLLIVPSSVMCEIEEATNMRDDRGLLTNRGRRGFRALQEALELSERVNIPGVSLLIHGETNPVLSIKNNSYLSKKGYGGDMAIRNQFKKFLSQINFHKGTFFLSSDKSCSAMALAEGLCPIYIPYNHLGDGDFEPFNIESTRKGEKKPHTLTFSAPLGNILYELAVSFGEIVVSSGDQAPTIKCDGKGEDIGRWVHKQLMISRKDLESLFQDYEGRFNLDRAGELLKDITKRFERVEWINEMDGALKI